MLRKCRGACSAVGRLPLRSPIDTGTVAQNGGIASKAGDRRSPQAKEDQTLLACTNAGRLPTSPPAPWAFQLMQIAGHFVNSHSGGSLPSSAKVLALLASSNADAATVQQAAVCTALE